MGDDSQDGGGAASPALVRCLGKKYILLSCVSGGICLVLGILYLAIYFTLSAYTTSLHYFQTMPTYIPAVVVRYLTVMCSIIVRSRA